MRKTKIICTLGPATDSVDMIEKLICAGMNTARLNFSHGTHDEQQKKIDNFKSARDRIGSPVALLLDTKGPEIRVKKFERGCIRLIEGQEFVLVCGDDFKGNEMQVSVNYEDLYKQVESGDAILIDDGKVKLKVERIVGKKIICRVLNSGAVSDRKGVNVPDVNLGMEYLSDQDKADIMFGIKNNVDYIAASFVRNKQDVLILKDFLMENGGDEIKVISKIENREGVKNFCEILEVSDGIMVARGDMGVEIDFEKLPGIQKKIIRACCEEGKIVITATQMLESMIENPAPTRAEITDVANAVYDGTSAVMLSGETTVGRYPEETVRTMVKIISQAENDEPKYRLNVKNSVRNIAEVSDAIGHAAYQAAVDLDASAIIAVTLSGHTAARMTKHKPPMPVIAATPSIKTYYQSALLRGVVPILTENTERFDCLMEEAIANSKRNGLIKAEDMTVITAGIPLQKKGTTNLLRVRRV